MLRLWRRDDRLFWAWIGILAIGVAIGFYAAIRRLSEGLIITNLHDLAPWGLWIVLDLSCIGLGAGAFSISALAYLLGRERFKSLARVAVFIGLLGYTGAMVTLFIEIGRPFRFWHGWVYWQPHSMLWEITMCLTLYFMVLIFEVFPIAVELPLIGRVVGEKWHTRLVNLGHRVHRFAPVLAVFGLGLSLLHQSSLGATYGVVAGRAAFSRPTVPLLFIVSAVGGGMAFTIQMTLLVQWLKGRVLVPRQVLFEAGQIAGAILLVYLYMRFWDATVGNYGYVPGLTEAQRTLTSGSRFAIPFWAWEIGLGGLVSGVLLILARRSRSIPMLMTGAGLAMAGLIANRWNSTMLSFAEPLATDPQVTIPLAVEYHPNEIEWMFVLGVVALLTLVFSLGMRYLPAYRGVEPEVSAVSEDRERVPAPASAAD